MASFLGVGRLGVLTFTNNVKILTLYNIHPTVNLNCKEYILSSFLSVKDNYSCT